MIWILALLVLAAGVGLALNMGVIPTSFSFVGLIIATSLANLFGKIFKWLLPHLGVENPITVWMISPIVGFFFVWIIIMSIGFEVHRRVYVFYKYKAGDLRLALWERLNKRLGACVGVLNGAAWLVLISFVIFNLSYWTAQVASSDNEAKTTRLLNNLGEGLQSTGLDKAARAVGSVPDTYYKTANFSGFLAQNPSVGSRLGSYPAFLSLAERDDIQPLTQDGNLTAAWQQGAPMHEILNDDAVKGILKNTNLTSIIWGTVQDNMDDLTNYLITGKSPKYDSEKIVGRWSFDLVPALAAEREAQPKINSAQMKELRAVWAKAFSQTTFVAGTDGQVFLKNVPNFKAQPVSTETWKGQWSGVGPYSMTFDANGQTISGTADTDGLRLTIKAGDNTYVFERAY
ncbi:MAG TPA: CvpA family protein [Pseudomonadales bacterium]|nr:CvpA family protein [Pseudomonadales bacterium]